MRDNRNSESKGPTFHILLSRSPGQGRRQTGGRTGSQEGEGGVGAPSGRRPTTFNYIRIGSLAAHRCSAVCAYLSYPGRPLLKSISYRSQCSPTSSGCISLRSPIGLGDRKYHPSPGPDAPFVLGPVGRRGASGPAFGRKDPRPGGEGKWRGRRDAWLAPARACGEGALGRTRVGGGRS